MTTATHEPPTPAITASPEPTSASPAERIDRLEAQVEPILAAAKYAPEERSDSVIEIKTACFDNHAPANLLSQRAYYLALLIYRTAGRATVTWTELRATPAVTEEWLKDFDDEGREALEDGEFYHLSDGEFDELAERIVWACSLAPKYADWIKSAPDPVKYLDAVWGNAEDDNKLGHRSKDRKARAVKAKEPLVPAWVAPTVDHPQLANRPQIPALFDNDLCLQQLYVKALGNRNSARMCGDTEGVAYWERRMDEWHRDNRTENEDHW
jgi:hypothetical protein